MAFKDTFSEANFPPALYHLVPQAQECRVSVPKFHKTEPGGMNMRKLGVTFLGVICTCWLLAGVAFAQSSGNFSAQIDKTVCTLDSSTGALSPECSPTANGTQCIALAAPFKISNGSGNTLLVTPSMVTGLFTDTKINTTINSSSADVGVQVCVTVTNPDGTPATGATVLGGDANGCVVYDQRFQQISSTLFSQLSECTLSSTACTSDSACASVGSTSTCSCDASGTTSCPTGTSGFCTQANNACNFELILSTLSAHSYNFIVNVPGGSYNVNAAWTLIGVNPTSGKSSSASVAACAGPGTLTVTQTKVFNNSGSVTTTP
jgi:hypothetical protein